MKLNLIRLLRKKISLLSLQYLEELARSALLIRRVELAYNSSDAARRDAKASFSFQTKIVNNTKENRINVDLSSRVWIEIYNPPLFSSPGYPHHSSSLSTGLFIENFFTEKFIRQLKYVVSYAHSFLALLSPFFHLSTCWKIQNGKKTLSLSEI